MKNGIKIEFTAQIWREDKMFIAQAMPLDVVSAGKSPEEARRALDEAVELFLETAKEHGSLDDILKECGYEIKNGVYVSPDWISIEKHQLAVGV
jgi:predicted RNase H-like HicB family nuclease